MGSLLVQIGRFDEALQSLQRYAEFEPEAWEGAYVMTKAWIGKHDYAHALDQIDRASALGGEDTMGAAIHLLRGDALTGLARYNEATLEFNIYLKRQPADELADMVRDMLVKIRSVSAMAQK
jgi:tetratricopeptide (TPR) repeat protein